MSNNIYAFTLQTATVTTGTPETVVADATAQNPVGALIKFSDNVYRYVKSVTGAGAVATAAAGMSYWKTLTLGGATPAYTVTSDVSDSLAPVNGGAGIYKGVVTTAYFTWVACGGSHLVQCAASVVTSDKLYGHATTDLILTRNAVATACPDLTYAIALESVSATVANQATSLLTNMIW